MDECTPNAGGDDDCTTGFLKGYHCDGTTMHCAPNATSTACIAGDQYAHGIKDLGACCTPTHNGQDGNECLGGICATFAANGAPLNNPYICIHPCKTDTDCPGAYYCAAFGDAYAACIPMGDTYTCSM